jgi:hypothetical protein
MIFTESYNIDERLAETGWIREELTAALSACLAPARTPEPLALSRAISSDVSVSKTTEALARRSPANLIGGGPSESGGARR